MRPLLLALAAASCAAAAPRPNPALPPAEVVRTVVDALAHNDSPLPNAGIFIAYHFASPANRANTGPYGRFLGIVRSEDSRPLLEGSRTEFGPIDIRGDQAEQRVWVRPANAPAIVYRFLLSRQATGECAGCWMVDGVIRAP